MYVKAVFCFTNIHPVSPERWNVSPIWPQTISFLAFIDKIKKTGPGGARTITQYKYLVITI